MKNFSSTRIENWPESVRRLSFRQQGIRLDFEEVRAIGRHNGLHPHLFESSNAGDVLTPLSRRLDRALVEFPGGAFVRLGSRSPKDTPLAILTGCRAERGQDVIRLLTDGSRRIFRDLWVSLRNNHQPWIFLREWHDIAWNREWRCFLREGRLVGISQYHLKWTINASDRERLLQSLPSIQRIMMTLDREMDGKHMVFDVGLDIESARPVTLIELNPWGPPTDAGLFSWVTDDFDGSVRTR